MRRGALAALLAAGGLVALAPVTAQGAQLHAFASAFGSPGAGAGGLSLLPLKETGLGNVHWLAAPGSGLAVNDETGDVYVADTNNHRIDEFTSAGAFIRAFGWEVNAEAPEAKLQACTEATGCQAGSAGTEPGQLGTPTYLAVDNDLSSPSHGDLYVADGVGVRGSNELQRFNIVNATGGTFTFSFEGETTEPIPYNAGNREVEIALGKLPAIGFGNAFLSGNRVFFIRRFEEVNVPQLVADSSGLSGAGATVEVSTATEGAPGSPEILTKFGPSGNLIESWGESGQLSKTPTLATGKGRLTDGQAIGTGNLSQGSATITNLNTQSGEFKPGQGIEGGGVSYSEGNRTGLPNYITAVSPTTLTLAKPVDGNGSRTLTTNNVFVTNLNTESGIFEGRQTISGVGIPLDTKVAEVGPSFLRLERPATTAGSGVSLSADRSFGQKVRGIATDQSGQLWIASGDFSGDVFEFDQAGGFVKRLQVPGGSAIDSAGNFITSLGQKIMMLDPTGTSLGSLYTTPSIPFGGGQIANPASIDGLALDPVTGELYLDEGIDGSSQIIDISHQCEPSYSGCLPSQEFGAAHLTEAAGLAVGPGGTIYAADAGPGHVVAFKVSLEANAKAATEVKARSAILNGTVNPEGGEVSACSFQLGTSKAYGQNLPCLNEAGEAVGTKADPLTGTEPIALHAEATGLKPGTTYHFRLRVLNATGEELHSEDEELETLVLPLVKAEEATEVGPTSATLKAEVNPQGLEVTSCSIEWGATAEPGNPALPYEHAEPCEPQSLPAGASPKPISLRLGGLSAKTSYHWRVAATDENGTETSPESTFVYLPGPPAAEVSQECGNEALREQNGSTALPDCRVYEMVTPPHKNGATVTEVLSGPPFSLSQNGSRLLAGTIQCFGDSLSCGPLRQSVGVSYEFSRSAGGWQTTPLTLSASQFPASTVLLESGDSPEQLFSTALPEPPPAAGREWLYARRPDGSAAPIGPVAEIPGYFKGSYYTGFAATADLSHLVYNSNSQAGAISPYWPSFDPTPAPRESIYEYAGAAEHPLLVPVSGGKGSTDLIGTCGARLALGVDARVLSADGRTVFFKVNACAGGTGANAGKAVPTETIYARIDGESTSARTVKISGPAPEPACDSACQAQPPADPLFAGDSTAGSKVYFLSTQQLTNEASEDASAGDSARSGCSQTRMKGGCNLYLYSDPQEEPEPSGNHLVAVSAGDSSGQGPQVQGVMAVSPDGNRAYFVAKGLLGGPNAEGNEPIEGRDNLYVYDAGEARTRFLAVLPGSSQGERSEWKGEAGGAIANVSADGRYLLFTSGAALTPDATHAGPEQVYRYDAQSERLTRVSIGRRGFDDNGNAAPLGADAAIVRAVQQEVQNGRSPLSPSMSADGRRVFFESPVALAPGALNDKPINNQGAFAENVYEWEQAGTEGCEEAAGCLALISDGRDVTEGIGGSSVKLIGTDAAGENVFFTTVDPLVPADADTGLDVYDARAQGGFAPPPHAVPCETTEACHPGTTEEGPGRSPSTNGFEGAQEGPNHPYALKCPKPKVKHHGVCVKPHKHRKRHRRARAGGGREGRR